MLIYLVLRMDIDMQHINENARTPSQCTLHICRTGKKEQYYTLYHEGIHVLPYMSNYFCDYNGNLSHSLDKAVEKAKVRFDELVGCGYWSIVNMELHDSPRLKYKRTEAFGATFETAKSGKVMYAYATSEFWDNWKADKQKIKDAGFWVKKIDGGWLVFCKISAEYDHS